MAGEASKSLTATMDRPGPSGTQSRVVKRFLSERELEQVIEEIYDNEGSEVDWSDSDVEQEEASVPINMSSDSSDSDAELRTRVDQSSGYLSRVRGRTRGHTVQGSRITGNQQPSDMEKDWKIEDSVRDTPFSSIPHISNASNINENLSPFQVFHIFVNNDIISHIKTETNRYAAQQIAAQKRKGPISKNSVFSRWKPVTISEIECFLAIIMHMGFVRKPRLRDYWSTNPIYDSKLASSLQISRDHLSARLSTDTDQRTTPQESGRLIGRNNFPYVIPVTPGSRGRRGQQKCKVCAEKVERTSGGVERKYTTIYCKQCGVSLCLGECFEAFHSKERYWLVH